MTVTADSEQPRERRRWAGARWSAAAAAAGVAALVGADDHRSASVAAVIILLAAALALARWRRRLHHVLAAFAALIALAGWALLPGASVALARPTLVLALVLALAWLLPLQRRAWGASLVGASGLIALMELLGQGWAGDRMPAGLAAGIVLLSVAWIASEPRHPPLSFLLSPDSTGWMLRRLLPLALGFALLLAWMEVHPAAWAPALLFVFAAFAVFITLVWHAATALDRLDISRADLQAYAHEISDLYHHAPCGYHSLDKDGRFVNINDTELGWLGYRREELLGRMTLPELLTPESRTTFARYFPELCRTGAVREVELDLQRKDGTILPVVLSATALRDASGRFQRTRASVFDATLRKQAEAAQRASEEQLRLLLNSTGEGIFALDLEGRCTLCNPAALRLLGYASATQLLGQSIHETIHHAHADGRPYAAGECKLQRAGEQGVGVEIDDEVFWRADGTSIPVEYRCYPIWRDDQRSARGDGSHDGRPAGSVVTFTDITARRGLETRIRHVQKMEAVGRLAAGIAHDFNNLLTIINGYSDMMLDEQPAPPLADMTRSIRQAGERAALLTRQLLAFSRQQVLQPRVLDLNARIRDIEPLLHRTLGEDIEISVHLSPALRAVQADPSQIDQVLMNLVLNARDAMPRHAGRIQILTTTAHLGAPGDRSHPDLPPGDYVELAVVDNGCGMLPEVQAHIFEPFFTTKPQGEGTGLGLPSVFGTARQSGGAVLVDSTWGRGTTMRVLLPALAEPLPIAEGAGSLLVVEDEPALCRLIAKVLQDRGYTVLTAAQAGQALTMLEALAQQPGVAQPPALLITDIGLPDMEGPELAERARTLFPALRVLFISGAAPSDATETSGSMLRKPFTPAELARAVQAQLTAAPAPLAASAAR